jgi:hypothetical protein
MQVGLSACEQTENPNLHDIQNHPRLFNRAGHCYDEQLCPNREITVPKYVPDIAKVQIWCAFAETNLGEATFEHPVK